MNQLMPLLFFIALWLFLSSIFWMPKLCDKLVDKDLVNRIKEIYLHLGNIKLEGVADEAFEREIKQLHTGPEKRSPKKKLLKIVGIYRAEYLNVSQFESRPITRHSSNRYIFEKLYLLAGELDQQSYCFFQSSLSIHLLAALLWATKLLRAKPHSTASSPVT